jgi:hypothetical protein
MKYNWSDESAQTKHYVRVDDGRIVGTIWQYVNNNVIWSSKILADEFPFTDSSGKHLGHYISQDTARRSVEKYWSIQERTLLGN